MPAADGHPVDADAMFDAAAQRLGGQLRETVEQNGIDAAHGVFGFGLVARTDHEAVAAATDLGALGDDVQGRAVAVGRKETHGIAFGFALLANLFRQADGGEGAAGAEPFVFGDGRPFDGLAEAARLGDGGVEIGAGRVVDGYADGYVGGVIADAAFGNGLSEGFFEEEGVGDDLQAIGGPGVGLLAIGASRLTALVFVGEIGAVASAKAIDFAGETERGAGEFEIDGFTVLVGFEGGVELAAGEDGGVGDADFLDFFEVEEPRAVSQGVQGHDTNRGFVGVDQGKSNHYLPPMRVQPAANPSPVAIGSESWNRQRTVLARS